MPSHEDRIGRRLLRDGGGPVFRALGCLLQERGLEEGARGGQSCSFGPIQITHLEYYSVIKRNKIYTHDDIDEPQKLYGNCKKPDTQATY